jgi:hypothetical protein
VSIVMYCSGLMFLKMTFLFQYYRVLAVQHMRIVYLVSMFIVGGWAFSQVMVGIFTCNPISGFWVHSQHPAVVYQRRRKHHHRRCGLLPSPAGSLEVAVGKVLQADADRHFLPGFLVRIHSFSQYWIA